MRGLAAIVWLLSAAAVSSAADCSRTSTGLQPLTGPFFLSYHGFPGGLYPDGAPTRSGTPALLARDSAGNPDPAAGRIVLLSIGMSNTTQEFTAFQTLASRDPDRNPQVVVVDGAQGGWSADRLVAAPDPYWNAVADRLRAANVTPAQVAAVWLKEADAQPTLPFPDDANRLQAELAAILGMLRDRFPNLKIVYFSSRIYGGYASSNLNPEPYAWQSAFAVKWLIGSQIDGALPDTPWLAWGPYLWADGLRPRFDGLTWACADFGEDGTHPSGSGRLKVARMLLDFLKTDPSARPWFVRPQPAPPTPRPTALVNAAGYFTPVAPGAIATLFGTDLTGGTYTAAGLPLPPGLGGTTVLIGNKIAPLYYASPNQINLLVPADPTDNTVVVRRESAISAPFSAVLALDSPGLFPVALHADGTPVTQASPAIKGETLQLFGTGKGLRNHAIKAAESPEFLPVVSIGGAPAEVKFWGAAPTWPGMDQANVVVPAAAPSASADTVQLQLRNFQSNTFSIPVR